MKKIMLIIKEFNNYFFLRKTLRTAELSAGDTPWNRFNLRRNWYGRIYTVVSLRDEDMGEEEIVRHWKAMERMRPINEYLSSLGLTEIIFPSIEQIPDSRSYLIVYSPIFKYVTLKWISSTLITIAILTTVILLINHYV